MFEMSKQGPPCTEGLVVGVRSEDDDAPSTRSKLERYGIDGGEFVAEEITQLPRTQFQAATGCVVEQLADTGHAFTPCTTPLRCVHPAIVYAEILPRYSKSALSIPLRDAWLPSSTYTQR